MKMFSTQWGHYICVNLVNKCDFSACRQAILADRQTDKSARWYQTGADI